MQNKKNIQVRFPSGSRWKCSCCGNCCRGYNFGPARASEIEKLKKLGIESRWEPARDGKWFAYANNIPGMVQGYYLNKLDDHCIFLKKDNLCTIHNLFGEAAKPAFCRQYPYVVQNDPGGLTVTVNEECGGLHKTFKSGKPVEQAIPDIIGLMPASPGEYPHDKKILYLPDFEAPYLDWIQLEEAIIMALDMSTANPYTNIFYVREMLSRHALNPSYNNEVTDFRENVVTAFETLYNIIDDPEILAAVNTGYYSKGITRQFRKVCKNVLKNINKQPPGLTDNAIEYLNLVLRTDFLSKKYMRYGRKIINNPGIPKTLGFYLISVIAAHFGHDRLPSNVSEHHLGAVLPNFRKLYTKIPVLKAISPNGHVIDSLFLSVPENWGK